MMDTAFTLESYIAEITPMVEELEKERAIVRQFSQTLDDLRSEMRRCDDNLSIYLAWQNYIGCKLQNSYDDAQLLELHGQSYGIIIRDDDRCQIHVDNQVMTEFFLCKHNYYTPIKSTTSLNHCLYCS